MPCGATMKVLLELRYVGERYHGWQVQSGAPSVQKTLQDAAEMLLMCECRITGCSRTDAGVHAKQFFCTLESETLSRFPIEKLPCALNHFLPWDVSVKSAKEVPESFHPRYDALGKAYEYLIFTGQSRDPFLYGRVWMLNGRKIDHQKMDEEAKKLLGIHDFSSFCAAGAKPGDRVREIYLCDVSREGDLICLRVCANGFLYNMVRIIAGTLYECAVGTKSDCSEILSGKNRALSGRTAPAQGLYLSRVFYDADALRRYKDEK